MVSIGRLSSKNTVFSQDFYILEAMCDQYYWAYFIKAQYLINVGRNTNGPKVAKFLVI